MYNVSALEQSKWGSHDRGTGVSPILPRVQVVDFFSGCGGTSQGLYQAGMTPIAAVDMDGEALGTFSLNFPSAKTIRGDIRLVHTSQLEPLLERERKFPLLFSACAPCQPFSRQNRQKRSDDTRASLLPELARFIVRFRPELIFIENVPGLQQISESDEGPLSFILALLKSLGYWYDVDVLSAQLYGVPQNRKRLVMIASAFGPVNLPGPTHGEGKAPLRTVRDSIAHFPPLSAGMRHDAVANHYACTLSPTNLRRIQATTEGGGRTDWDDELKLDCHRSVKGYTDVYGRMSWDKPAPSLTTRCVSLSNGRFGHPEQDRAISIREAASIQTFPDEFMFSGSVNGMARQIGNAVPPALAERIGSALIDHVEQYWKLPNG